MDILSDPQGKTVFICEKYPELVIEIKPLILREVNGVILKEHARQVIFERNSGNVGEFKTSDAKVIDGIKQNVMSTNGTVIIAQTEKDLKTENPDNAPVEVKVGAVGTENTPEPTPPAEEKVNPQAAKTPGRKAGRPKKVTA